MLSFFNKRFFIIFLFPILLGGITVFSFQPYNLFFINFLSLPLLFFIIIYVKKKIKEHLYKKTLFKKFIYFRYIIWFWFLLFWHLLDCTFFNI